MEIGRIIGRGKTAEVYELSSEKVLKLFYSYTGEDLSQYELNVGRAVYDAGVSSPKAYEQVQVMGRNGIIVEHAGVDSMFASIKRRPWAVVYYAREMARLHAKMHSCYADQLLSQNEVLKSNISISADILGEKAGEIIDYMAGLPGGTSICHGDLHPKNIFVGRRGYIAIDWADAYSGNCAGDVARTALILVSPHMPSGSGVLFRLLIKTLRKNLLNHYLEEYVRLRSIRRDEINQWVLPVAAARLKEEIPGEREWLMGIIENRIQLLF